MHRLLAKKAGDRYGSASELLAALLPLTAPHALPIVVRDHHAARSDDPILPPDPEHHDDGPNGAFLGMLCAALVYIAAGIAIGLRTAGRI